MWRLLTVGLLLAACSSWGCCTSVFYSSKDANKVLRIQKRSNTFLEELKPGSVERECIEELCDFEEASEIFETKEKTLNFWSKYVDGDQCKPNPCSNGICKDSIGKFSCICNKGWEGVLCNYEVKYSNCSMDNGGCEHFCREDPAEQHRLCSCASGYQLRDDHTTCEPVVEFPCGRVKSDYIEAKADFNIRLINGTVGRRGGSPWQIMLQNTKGMFLCGGVLIHPAWVLTAAHCLEEHKGFKVKLEEQEERLRWSGRPRSKAEFKRSFENIFVTPVSCKSLALEMLLTEKNLQDLIGSLPENLALPFLLQGKFRFRPEADEQTIWIDKWVTHENYTKTTSDNDIAMLHLAEHVMYYKYALPICLPTRNLAEQELMRSGRQAVVTGWGTMSERNLTYAASLRYIQIPIVPRNECAQAMSSQISDNMLCAGSLGDRKDSCRGDSGGPMFTRYKDTWFLVGLVSWGEGCGRKEKFGVYTKVSQYLEWIQHHIDRSARLKG